MQDLALPFPRLLSLYNVTFCMIKTTGVSSDKGIISRLLFCIEIVMHLPLSTILSISAVASARQVLATSFGSKRFSKAKEEVELNLEAPRTE